VTRDVERESPPNQKNRKRERERARFCCRALHARSLGGAAAARARQGLTACSPWCPRFPSGCAGGAFERREERRESFCFFANVGCYSWGLSLCECVIRRGCSACSVVCDVHDCSLCVCVCVCAEPSDFVLKLTCDDGGGASLVAAPADESGASGERRGGYSGERRAARRFFFFFYTVSLLFVISCCCVVGGIVWAARAWWRFDSIGFADADAKGKLERRRGKSVFFLSGGNGARRQRCVCGIDFLSEVRVASTRCDRHGMNIEKGRGPTNKQGWGERKKGVGAPNAKRQTPNAKKETQRNTQNNTNLSSRRERRGRAVDLRGAPETPALLLLLLLA
jgi:hypothetical protein